MSKPLKNGSHLFRLPKELRDEVYKCLFDPEQAILFYTLSLSELPDVLKAAKPLLGMDPDGTAHREALLSWLRTRTFIFDGRRDSLWTEVNEMLKPHGLDIFAELRRVEIWAWTKDDLLACAQELQRCIELKTIKVLLGERLNMSISRAARLFEGYHGPLQLRIYREDEYVENDEPVCKRTMTIPARTNG